MTTSVLEYIGELSLMIRVCNDAKQAVRKRVSNPVALQAELRTLDGRIRCLQAGIELARDRAIVVRAGMTLEEICRARYHNVREPRTILEWDILCARVAKFNNIASPDVLFEDEILILPQEHELPPVQAS
jgi:hypothetical protein